MVTTGAARLAARPTACATRADVSGSRAVRPKPYLSRGFNLAGSTPHDDRRAVGLVQLAKMDRYIDERQKWAEFYARELGGISWLGLPRVPAGDRHGWQSYVCMVDEQKAGRTRNEIMDRLMQKGINTRPGTHAVHMLGYYREKFGLRPEDFPRSRDCDRLSMAIPLHNRMTADDYAYVVRSLHDIHS